MLPAPVFQKILQKLFVDQIWHMRRVFLRGGRGGDGQGVVYSTHGLMLQTALKKPIDARLSTNLASGCISARNSHDVFHLGIYPCKDFNERDSEKASERISDGAGEDVSSLIFTRFSTWV